MTEISDPTETLQRLITFSKKLPVPCDQVKSNALKLLEHFSKQSDTSVRTKIAWLLGKLCQTARFYPGVVLNNIIPFLESETSSQVLAQLWSSVTGCVKNLATEKKIHKELIDLACKSLLNNSHRVRSECLLFLGNISTVEKGQDAKNEKRNIQTIIGDYFGDPEPRVRSNALQAMILLHQRCQKLELQVYGQVCSALSDDYEGVRCSALNLVWILSQIYPESPIVSINDEHLRLVDDAFAKICDMVNDSSYKVRAAAAGLLGSMHLVSNSFLFQTLDKKIMSDLKKKKSLNEKAKEGYVCEFSSGSAWADDAPKDVDHESSQLMSGGACGAFVHGLEDEMMEVRTASVDSLTELACHRIHSKFPQAALDFLVDCLNDEIEAVRLNAVNSLHKIMQNVALLEDQLENVLCAMEDHCKEIREGIHQLLSNCSLTSKFCLNETVMKLLKNLTKYPKDRHSIWKAYKHLGQHHSQLVYLLVPHLLSCHPYFDMPEPNMDDPGYIGVLILVFNAAENCSKMAQLFPDHVVRHYQYLRDSIPNLVPQQIKLTTFASGDEVCLHSPPRRTESSSDPSEFLERALERVKNLQMHDSRTQRSLLLCTINDLKHIARVAPSVSPTATSSAIFLQTQLLLSEVVEATAQSGSTSMRIQHSEFARPAVTQIKELTYELEHLFLGISTEEVALLRQMRLKAEALEFLVEMQQVHNSQSFSVPPPPVLCQSFFNVIQDVRSYLSKHDMTPDSFSKTLFNEVLKLDPTKKFSLVLKLLRPLLYHHSVSSVTFSNTMLQSKVIIHQPKSRTDASISFAAGLATSIEIDATAVNVPCPIKELRVQVKYPDLKTQTALLQASDLKQVGPLEYHINTKVSTVCIDSSNRLLLHVSEQIKSLLDLLFYQMYLSHHRWTDACHIKLQFVKVFSRNVPQNSDSDLHFLPISDIVELSLHPKPINRL